MHEVMEIARFSVNAGTDVAAAAASVDTWLARQPGFLGRTLVGPDAGGRYTDLVRWRSAADAHAAMQAFEQDPGACAFMAAIDPATVEMSHLPVVLVRSAAG